METENNKVAENAEEVLGMETENNKVAENAAAAGMLRGISSIIEFAPDIEAASKAVLDVTRNTPIWYPFLIIVSKILEFAPSKEAAKHAVDAMIGEMNEFAQL